MAFSYEKELFLAFGATTIVIIIALLLVLACHKIANSDDKYKNVFKVYEATIHVYCDYGEKVNFEYVKAKNKQDVWLELYDRYEGCPHNYRVERVRKCK